MDSSNETAGYDRDGRSHFAAAETRHAAVHTALESRIDLMNRVKTIAITGRLLEAFYGSGLADGSPDRKVPRGPGGVDAGHRE